MTHLQSVARALGGQVAGRGVLCPGPGHSDRDRSLSVSFDERAPEGFMVHSFAGDDWRECRDHVKARLNIMASLIPVRQPTAHIVRADTSKTDFAGGIWKQSVPAIGSPVEAYLTGRDLELVPELSELGFHPHCPFKGEQVGALIAPMTDAVSGAFRGIHRTRLNPKDKAMLGPAKGAVVRLSPDDGVTDGLHICEGIETGLALLAMGFRPLWCALSAGGIARFPVLDGIEALTIFADRDANQAGEHAALDCADRWRAAGREVRILAAPEVGTDFADYRRAA
jgi:putative DNA primase/helicase